MKKTFWIIAIVLILFLICGGIYLCLTKRNVICVANNADKSINFIQITVCNKVYRIENINPGAEKLIEFSISGDSGFLVIGKFEDGTAINGSFGYVTKSYKAEKVRVFVDSSGSVQGKQL